MGSVLVYVARWSCLLGLPFHPLHYSEDFKYLNKMNLWSDGLFGIKCKNQCLVVYWGYQFAVTFPHIKSIYRHFKGIRKLLKNFKQDLKANKPQVLRVTTKKRPFLLFDHTHHGGPYAFLHNDARLRLRAKCVLAWRKRCLRRRERGKEKKAEALAYLFLIKKPNKERPLSF